MSRPKRHRFLTSIGSAFETRPNLFVEAHVDATSRRLVGRRRWPAVLRVINILDRPTDRQTDQHSVVCRRLGFFGHLLRPRGLHFHAIWITAVATSPANSDTAVGFAEKNWRVAID